MKESKSFTGHCAFPDCRGKTAHLVLDKIHCRAYESCDSHLGTISTFVGKDLMIFPSSDVDNVRRLRPAVLLFAFAMENILQRNDHKGGWEYDTIDWLFRKLIEEVGEVGQILAANPEPSREYDAATTLLLSEELIDVANVAMMIRDNLLRMRLDL